ncbi:MAG TPA: sialidase family protein [Ktedonobacteraceae bacterium]|nr:sialidase family protein [Ktedonobacteraceae bacterium]
MRKLRMRRYKWLGPVGAVLAPTILLVVLVMAHVIPLPAAGKAVIFGTPSNYYRQPLQLSSDSYTNPDSQHSTEVEPDTYSYGSTIVTAFQAGRFAGGGSSNNGWATSTDGGLTWKSGFLPGTTLYVDGHYTRVSDPSVAYDAAHHTWIISSLAEVGSGSTLQTHAVIVNLSTDGGLTWSKPYKVIEGGSTYYDKDWITCDASNNSPFYGHCYAEWDNDDSGGLILMSTSTDGGKTWGKPQTTADKAHGLGGQPLVQPGGTVIVPIAGYGTMNLLSFVSTDGGRSWSKTSLIASINGNVLPSAQIDGAGKVYLVWIDCQFEKNCNATGGSEDNDIRYTGGQKAHADTRAAGPPEDDLVMSTTTDGIHWTQPRLIPADPTGSGIDHLIPGIGVDRNTSGASAHLALAFYYHPLNCDASDCPYSPGFVSSTDGGAHWTQKITLAGPMDLSWLPNGRNKVGDYISTSFCNGLAFPVFSIAFAPDQGHFNEAMYTISGGLSV